MLIHNGNRIEGPNCDVKPRAVHQRHEWVRKDVGRIFIQIFDMALGAWMGQEPSLCVFAETCGDALIIEHNLGNIHDRTIAEMVQSDHQIKFGQDKKDTLPRHCLDCDVRFVCNGGCPKHRFIKTPSGEEGLNYFCRGLQIIL